MPRMVKCRKCGEKIDQKLAFKVVVGDKNTYYCNEEEYNSVIKERQDRELVYDLINQIFGYVVTNTALYKEINALAKCYPYDSIGDYLADNFDYLHDVMHRDFEKEYGQIRYFSTILNNNMRDFINDHTPEPVITHQVEDDVVNMKFKRNKKRRALDDLM